MMRSSSWLFLMLCGVGCFSFVSYNLVRMPALAPFTESLGASPQMVGMIVAASTMTGVFLKLPIGALSDIVNRRRLMLIGVLAFALPPFVYPLVTDLGALAMVRVGHGLATAIFTPLALATVAEWYQEHRGVALGWYTSAAQGGAFLGPVLGGWLLDEWGFTMTFEMAGIFGVLALGCYLIVLKAPNPIEHPVRESGQVLSELLDGVKRVVCHGQMIATSLAEAAKMMANGTLMAFLPLYGLSVGLSLTESGWLFGIQGVTSFVAKPIMGRVSDVAGRRPLIVAGLMICGISMMGIPHVSDFWILLMCAAFFGFGEAVITSSSAALIADLSGGKTIGAGMGLRGTIMDMGHAGGPVLAGVLIGTIGYTAGFLTMGAIQFLAAVGFGLVMAYARVTQGRLNEVGS